jgi:glyoxylase-like metal-dependent hydrolase (beta-lactamase superfamily II)
MNPAEVASKLYLIPLDQNLPGFISFIGAWLYKGEHTVLVDVGPGATVPGLVEALGALGVKHLDAILLTHVHIDHAGGIGDLILHFPDTPVVCHESAIRHLTDPSRLWEGSLRTLGDTARAYGPIRPVPLNLLCDATRYQAHDIDPIPTPGHAPHHVSYMVDTYLFAGEAGGVCLDISGGDYYLRPATPPRFFLENAVKSIDALIAKKPSIICYGHFGIKQKAVAMLKTHREQLFFWKKIVRDETKRKTPADGVGFFEACLERLLKEDSLMAGYFQMAPAVQEREKGFLRNSIKGFAGYLSHRQADSA